MNVYVALHLETNKFEYEIVGLVRKCSNGEGIVGEGSIFYFDMFVDRFASNRKAILRIEKWVTWYKKKIMVIHKIINVQQNICRTASQIGSRGIANNRAMRDLC